MTNEHEKLPSGKLAEAVTACHKALARKHPQQTLAMVDNFEHLAAVVDAARKYLALEPLLRELCEAAKDAGEKPTINYNGEWKSPDMDSDDLRFYIAAYNITARIRLATPSNDGSCKRILPNTENI